MSREQQQLSAEEKLMLELITRLRLAIPDDLAEVSESTLKREQLDQILLHTQQQLQLLSDIMTRAYFQKEAPLQQLVRMRPGGGE